MAVLMSSSVEASDSIDDQSADQRNDPDRVDHQIDIQPVVLCAGRCGFAGISLHDSQSHATAP